MHSYSLFATLCLVLLLPSSQGLFQDQQGSQDWYLTSIGRVQSARLHSRKPRLSVATSANILATLNLRDGEVLWRRELPEAEGLQGMDVCEGAGLVFSLSGGGGGMVRAWDQLHGVSVWEKELNWEAKEDWSEAAGAFLRVWEREEEEAMVVVLGNGMLKAYDVQDGEHVWSVNVGEELDEVNNTALEIVHDGFIVGLVDLRTDRAQLLAISKEGKIQKENIFSSSTSLSNKIAVSGNAIVVASKNSSKGCTGLLGESGTLSCMDIPGSEESRVFASGVGLVSLSGNSLEGTGVIHAGGPSLLPGITALSSLVHQEDQQVVGIVSTTEEGISLAVINVMDMGELYSEKYNGVQIKGTLGPIGAVDQVFLGNYFRKDGSVGFRALIVGEDDSVSLLQQGRIVWAREEGLGSIHSTVFIDPPAASGAGHSVDVMKRIRVQVLMLKEQFHLISEDEDIELKSSKREISGQNMNIRDANGLRKLIIGVSPRKVFALHSGDGHIVWSRILLGSSEVSQIVLYRYSHNLQEAPWVALLYHDKCVIVDAHTGEVVESHDFPAQFHKVIELPNVVKVGDSDQHVFLLVMGSEDEGLKAHLLPNIPASRDLLNNMEEGVSTWTGHQANGILKGYHLNRETMLFSEQWALVLHSPILATSARSPLEAVHSHVKVLGDRTLKYKYLNPNTLFVASGVENGQSSISVDSDEVDLSVHIVDTVTGRILYRQIHQGARGPVYAVFSQHCIVYHYWSLQNGRYEVSVLELYDASPKIIDVWKLMFFPDASREKMSSHEPVPLEVSRSTHFTSTPVKALAVTRTLRGITTQRVLIGTVSDQVYSMDKRFLDPRRPRGKITTEAREERLIPYQENLLLFPTQYASQDRQIVGLKHIESVPTGLESSSHILAYGVDIFYTKVQPEKAFDSLEEDFAFAFLVLTIVAMLVGVVVMHHMVKRSKISQKWK